MYTFQLEGLPPNTLPDGMKFVRDCKDGDKVRRIGFIRFGNQGYNNKKEWVVKSYELVRIEGRPLVGWFRFYASFGLIRADIDYKVDMDIVVEVIE